MMIFLSFLIPPRSFLPKVAFTYFFLFLAYSAPSYLPGWHLFVSYILDSNVILQRVSPDHWSSRYPTYHLVLFSLEHLSWSEIPLFGTFFSVFPHYHVNPWQQELLVYHFCSGLWHFWRNMYFSLDCRRLVKSQQTLLPQARHEEFGSYT